MILVLKFSRPVSEDVAAILRAAIAKELPGVPVLMFDRSVEVSFFGASPIAAAKEQIATGMAAEKLASELAARGAMSRDEWHHAAPPVGPAAGVDDHGESREFVFDPDSPDGFYWRTAPSDPKPPASPPPSPPKK